MDEGFLQQIFTPEFWSAVSAITLVLIWRVVNRFLPSTGEEGPVPSPAPKKAKPDA